MGQLGIHAEIYFWIALLENFEMNKEKNNANPSQRLQFAISWMKSSVNKSHFVDYFSQVMETLCPGTQTVYDYFLDLSAALKVGISEQMVMALSLMYSPMLTVQRDGIRAMKKKLGEYYQNGKPALFPQYCLSALLFQLKNIHELREMENEIKFLLESVNEYKSNEIRPLVMIEDAVKWHNQVNLDEIPPLKDYLKPVDLLKDLGPSCQMGAVLQDLMPLSDDEIMQCLLFMANANQATEDKQTRIANELYCVANKPNGDWESLLGDEKPEKKGVLSWNMDHFISLVSEKQAQVKWNKIVEKLDRPKLKFNDQKSWVALMTVIAKIKKSHSFQFPSRLILDKWYHKASQLEFVTHMLKVGKPELVFWNEFNKKTVDSSFKQVQPILAFWTCIEFVQLMIELSESFIVEIKELFEIPIKLNPDLVILSLAQVNPICGGALIDELFTYLFPNYVTQHANSVQVLEQLWRHNQFLVISGICELYRKELNKKDNSCLNLSRVLDITQSITQN